MKRLMIFALSILLVMGFVLTGGCVGDKNANQQTLHITENVTAQEASTLIQNNRNNPDFIIIDVRTPQEFAEGHIENARNVDFYSENFRNEIAQLERDKIYLIYCRSGNRSGNALNLMAEFDFGEVYNFSGGIIAWNAQGLPTTKR